jgi:hypothetical protein
MTKKTIENIKKKVEGRRPSTLNTQTDCCKNKIGIQTSTKVEETISMMASIHPNKTILASNNNDGKASAGEEPKVNLVAKHLPWETPSRHQRQSIH